MDDSPFVTEVAEVEVDVVEAVEGGASLKHQQRHMSTDNLASYRWLQQDDELIRW